ncbi:hypothetical protein HDU96_010311 [Phlyctochytrium bullatum]|nr:hypothetical protein HDU96_010311 [Phlyctochytrium bullatum]
MGECPIVEDASPPTPPRDRFFRNVSPVILLHIAQYVHPYTVAETLPRINRAWHRTLTAAPISFAKANLVYGLPSRFHLQVLDWMRVLPVHVAAFVVENGFLPSAMDVMCRFDDDEHEERMERMREELQKRARRVTEVNAFLMAAMHEALITRSVNVLQMLLQLHEEKPDMFRPGVVFPVPEDAFNVKDTTWFEPESWKVARILLSDPRGNTRRFRQLVATKVNLGANLPLFLKEFCSPYDSFESLDKCTFEDTHWGDKMKELLKVLIDNHIKLSLADLLQICIVATTSVPATDFHESVQEIAKRDIMLRLSRTSDDNAQTVAFREDIDRVVNYSLNSATLELFLNIRELDLPDSQILRCYHKCLEPSCLAAMLRSPVYSLKDRTDFAIQLALYAACFGNFNAIQTLHEELGLELCRDAGDAKPGDFCLFRVAKIPKPDVIEGVLRLRKGRGCSHLSYPRVWESAFKNPDVRVVKLLLPFQPGFDEFKGRVDMKLDGEDLMLHLHSTMDCGAGARRNSMECAIEMGWPRLIKALARVLQERSEYTVDDYREFLQYLIGRIEPEVVQALLSVLSPTGLERMVDFQGLLYDGITSTPARRGKRTLPSCYWTRGADPNTNNVEWRTALHLLAIKFEWGSRTEELFRRIRERDVRLYFEDGYGYSAFDYAGGELLEQLLIWKAELENAQKLGEAGVEVTHVGSGEV